MILPWLLLVVACAMGWYLYRGRERLATAQPDARPVLAVLGDSDSHAYHDALHFPVGGSKRGGAHHATTLQWTEVLDRLRGDQVDQGAWGVHGTRGMVARANRWLGREGRSPPKQDFHYNFALSGAQCGDLLTGYSRQAYSLASLMDQEPARWRNGVVLIRIGINDIGDTESLDRLARDPFDARVQASISTCIQAISASVRLIRSRHPQVAIVLVGIFDNAQWARNLGRWRNPDQLAHISQGLDVYDQALVRLAAGEPRTAFFSDRRWFGALWGGRDPSGLPAYRTPLIGGLRVPNREGDSPDNAVLADGHAGTAWNAEWARALVQLLDSRFGYRIDPLRDEEIAVLLAKG